MKHLGIVYSLVIFFGASRDPYTYVGASVTCGGHSNSSTGLIISPTENGTYPSNTVCVWTIEDPNKNQIVLDVQEFRLESCGSCSCDYLEIRNGDSETSPLVGKYCGTIIPKNFTSLGYQMYLKFRTDHSDRYEGLKIAWGSATIGSYSFDNASQIHGGHFYSSKGVITSPNYPLNYPHSVKREWVIEVPEDHVAVLTVKEFSLESDCAYDYLEIRNGSTANTSTLIGRYCGSSGIPPRITSTGSRIFLRFSTDSSVAYKGFAIEWDTTKLGCGGNLTSDHGSFSSPNYPAPYTPSGECYWNIQVAAGSVIQLIIVDLEFEAAEQCRFNFLEVYEGEHTRGKKLGTYCKTINHPLYIETTTNAASFRFRSDHAVSSRRFRIVYHTICQNKLYGSNGVIESPNSPNNYPDQENCSWIIEVPSGKNFKLTFPRFNLEGGPGISCNNDYLEITEGENYKPNRTIGKFCNSVAPPPLIVTTQRQVFLQFHSDNSTSRNGFRLEWTVNNSYADVDASELCHIHFNSSTGLITSPEYPERYPVNTTCEWIIEDPNKHQLVLHIDKFELERCEDCSCDYLEIRNGGSETSPLVGKYCGTTIPTNILSFGHQMYLKFKTDSAKRHQGFNIAWGSATIGSHAFDGASGIHGGHFYSLSGVVTSPNYPEHYPDNLEREWIIEVPRDHLVVLNVKKFNVQPHADCASDYLEVRNGSSLGMSQLIGKYCGRDIPEKINVIGKQIFLQFKSDGADNYQGFVIEWDSIDLECGGNLTGSFGSISFPYYPELYNPSIECNWNIRVSAGSIIQLILVDLEFEAAEHCRFNFIEIYEGNDARGKRLGTYCQTINHPVYVETTSNLASVRFRSDYTTSGRRFRIIYHTICQNTLFGPEGVIESPNFPNNYPNRENCSWKIEVPVGKNLELRFSQFDLEGGLGNSCHTDYLEIAEGENDRPITEIGKFCNSTAPPSAIVTTQRQVFLHFHSNNYTSRNGFRLSWTAKDHNGAPPTSRTCLLWSQPVLSRDDYTYTLGVGGHKLHTRAVTWNEARITCEEEGGHLAIINSIDEVIAISELFGTSRPITESQNSTLASIGFHDLFSEGQYVTIYGESLSSTGFSQWAVGQPDNHGGSENCGALSINGELSDISCSAKYGFICEIPMLPQSDHGSYVLPVVIPN